MSSLKQAANGDIVIADNQFSFVTGVDEVVQLLRHRLRTFLGEWFLDNTIGVPYFQDIFKKRPNPIAIEAGLKNEILSTPGVLELLKFDIDVDPTTRKMTVDASILVSDEIIDFSEVLGI